MLHVISDFFCIVVMQSICNCVCMCIHKTQQKSRPIGSVPIFTFLFSGEAVLNPNDIVNQHNSGCWSIDDFHLTAMKHLPKKQYIIFLCGIYGTNLVGPYFFHYNV